MSFSTKTTKLATKLIRLTSDDKITWKLRSPPNSVTGGTNDIVPLFFETEYQDKHVAIYQQRWQNYHSDTDSVYWSETTAFAILDDQDRVLWESKERSPALSDLMDTVREKAAGLDDLFNDD